ncbi:MAG: hypothetical protein RL885_31470 [Planctomycetota bacterium]
MKRLVEQIDRLLRRIPPDSHYGRQVRNELLGHLEESVAEKVTETNDLDEALDRATAAIGEAGDLERVYYRDYLASRYWLGFFDREWLLRREMLGLRVGAFAMILGLCFGALLPGLTAFVRFRTAVGQVAASTESGASQFWLSALRDVSGGTTLFSWLDGGLGFRLLVVLGLLAFALAGSSLYRSLFDSERRIQGRALWLAPIAAAVLVFTWRAEDYAIALSTMVQSSPTSQDFDLAAGRLAWSIAATAVLALILGAWAVVLTRRARRDDVSAEPRPLLTALVLLGAGGFLASHPLLWSTLQRARAAVSGEPMPPPAVLASSIHLDFVLFVMGGAAVIFALYVLMRQLLEVERVYQSRRHGEV